MLLTTKNDNTATLESTAVDKLIAFERAIKEAKAKEEALKAEILAEMEERGILKIETDELTITYVAETERETFDTKAFRDEYAELYDDYVKMTTVKPSIRIKVR